MKNLAKFMVVAVALAVIPALAFAATTPSITSPANNATFNVGQSISFAGSATGGTAPYSFVWTFGDSTTAFGENYSKSYATAGTKTVRLTASDHNAVEGETTITLNIVAASSTDALTISNIRVTDITQTGAIVRWTTNRAADSRVIYDTASHTDISGATGPNFGYAFSTATSETNPKVTEHAVTVSGLSANTQYFYCVISQE